VQKSSLGEKPVYANNLAEFLSIKLVYALVEDFDDLTPRMRVTVGERNGAA